MTIGEEIYMMQIKYPELDDPRWLEVGDDGPYEWRPGMFVQTEAGLVMLMGDISTNRAILSHHDCRSITHYIPVGPIEVE